MTYTVKDANANNHTFATVVRADTNEVTINTVGDATGMPITNTNPLPVTLAVNTISTNKSTFNQISANTTNIALVKSSPGNLLGGLVSNVSNTTWYYVKLFDKATTPILGTDIPELIIPVPPAKSTDLTSLINGNYSFQNGLATAVTAAASLTDATIIAANTVILSLIYV